jgi:hypothetical protein
MPVCFRLVKAVSTGFFSAEIEISVSPELAERPQEAFRKKLRERVI